jgi:hypothetical protein
MSDPNKVIDAKLKRVPVKEYVSHLYRGDQHLWLALRDIWDQLNNLTGPEPVGPAMGIMTFGLANDTVGTNTPGHYGNIQWVGSPFQASISCVTLPTTGPATFDVLFSHDQGTTWKSIFHSGSPFTVPTTAKRITEFTKIFNEVNFVVGDLLRVDTLASGGATGITGTVQWG